MAGPLDVNLIEMKIRDIGTKRKTKSKILNEKSNNLFIITSK